MKKLLLAFILIAAITGCDEYGRDSAGVAHANDMNNKYTIISIESKNEIHEYLIYRRGNHGGITHLPNCKYCKEMEF